MIVSQQPSEIRLEGCVVAHLLDAAGSITEALSRR